MSSPGTFIAAGAADVARAQTAWRIWWMLARNDIARRYRRSSLGPFWLTLSMGVMVAGLGVVYTTIFRTSIGEYLPFLACSLVFWTFMSVTVIESCGAFSESENIIRQIDIANFSFVQRVVLRNLIILGHNIIIIPATMLVLAFAPGWTAPLFLVGVLLTIVNLTWLGYVLAITSTRFRDVPLIVQNVMQLGFFITPVMFQPSQLGHSHPLLVFNPFAILLELMRAPLLGSTPPLSSYFTASIAAVVGWTFAVWLCGRFGKRVIYWL